MYLLLQSWITFFEVKVVNIWSWLLISHELGTEDYLFQLFQYSKGFLQTASGCFIVFVHFPHQEYAEHTF